MENWKKNIQLAPKQCGKRDLEIWRTLQTEFSKSPKLRKTLHFAKKKETIIDLEYNSFSNFETTKKLSHRRGFKLLEIISDSRSLFSLQTSK